MKKTPWKIIAILGVMTSFLIIFSITCSTNNKAQEKEKATKTPVQEKVKKSEIEKEAQVEKEQEHSDEGRSERPAEHPEEGEESGQPLSLNETYNKVRKGVWLILAYDRASSSFVGTVENVTKKTIKSVRVEVHLSNGTELGPTKSIDLAPGEKASLKLSAVGQSFRWYKAHAEAGSGEHSGEHRGERAEGVHTEKVIL